MPEGQREVSYEVKGSAAWVTIDREERHNTLSEPTIEQMLEALEQAAEDEQVHAVCITGAGDAAFCAGADLRVAAITDDGGETLGLDRYAKLLEYLHGYSKPLVARLAGHCVGGGVGLALACDLAYAADDVRVGTPEVGVGLFPMMVTALLPRDASRKKVLEMVFTGALVGASEAETMGLITRAVPRGELDARVDETLETIGSKAPLALSIGRRAWAATEEMSISDALKHLCEQLEMLMKSDDAAEGMAAFAEKRAPKWTGK